MVKIRLVKYEEIKQLAEMGKMMHAEGLFSKFDYDEEKVVIMLSQYVTDDDRLALVATKDDEIIGWFLASLSFHYFGTTKLAIEQCMYIHPLHRGAEVASRFMDKFEHWARYMEAKVMLFMPCNNGVDERWDKFAKRNGYVQTGYIFQKDL